MVKITRSKSIWIETGGSIVSDIGVQAFCRPNLLHLEISNITVSFLYEANALVSLYIAYILVILHYLTWLLTYAVIEHLHESQLKT